MRHADGVRNLLNIVSGEEELFIIVSAMGKTTNALEEVFDAMRKGDIAFCEQKIAEIKEYHYTTIADLFGCSIDFLLCRTDIPEVASTAPAPTAPVSKSDSIGHPIAEEPPVGVDLIWVDAHGYSDTGEYRGGQRIETVCTIQWEDARWWAMPPTEG